MTWLSGPAVWIGGIVAAAFAAAFAAWLMLFLQFLPPPQQVWLRLTNASTLGEHPNPAIRDHLKSGHRPSSRPGR